MEKIADRIRVLVELTGLTLPDFASRCDISRTALVTYRDGDREPPLSFLEKACGEFGVTREWMILGEGDPPRSIAALKSKISDLSDVRNAVSDSAGEGRFRVSEMEEVVSETAEVSAAELAGVRRYRKEGPEELTVPEWQPDFDAFGFVPLAEAHINAGNGAFVLSERMREHYAFRKDWLRAVSTSPKNLVLLQVDGDSMRPALEPGDVVLVDRGRNSLRQDVVYAFGLEDTIVVKRADLRGGGLAHLMSDNRSYAPIPVCLKDIRIIGQVIWYARQLVR